MGAGVVSIATSPNAPARVYAAVDTGNDNDPTNGLWISIDAGASWSQSAVTSGAKLSLVRVSPTNANVVYATDFVDANGVATLFRSTDGGASFGPVVQSSGSFATLALAFVDVQQDPFDAMRVVALTAPIPADLTDRRNLRRRIEQQFRHPADDDRRRRAARTAVRPLHPERRVLLHDLGRVQECQFAARTGQRRHDPARLEFLRRAAL
jgi:hypothetical protein